MKEGFDKEIDTLLRRRAGASAAQSFADGGGFGTAPGASAHLDADELGAFAEGALPSGARLAAASHLAECDRCRGVAVALSRSLGAGEVKQHAAAVPASTATPRPASWRAWAAALFAPRTLRYAAPLLALSVVAVVSFVALRSRNAGSLQNTQTARPQVETAGTRPAPDVAATPGTFDEGQPGLVEGKSADKAGEAAPSSPTAPPPGGRGPSVNEERVESSGTAADTAAPVAAPPPPPSASSPEAAPVEIAKSAPRPVAAETSQPVSKSDGGDSNKEKSVRSAEPVDEVAANEAATQQQRRAANTRAANELPDGGNRAQKRADTNTSNIYGENNAPRSAPRESEREDRDRSGSGGGALAARRGRANTRTEQKTEDDETTRVGETRSAAGHRFRREGSAWVDVNYKPSMRSTGVRRGTDAFRALVADVPVIGRVAEQLGGEVIVVVSGRAYRIR